MRFTKMQGVGNDFVVVDTADLPPRTSLPALAVRACDRKFGVGADGLLVVLPGTRSTAFGMRMFNPDGSEDMCGNGLRCVSLWALRAGRLGKEAAFMADTKEGVRHVRRLEAPEDGRTGMFGVDMGRPRLAPVDLPFQAPPGVNRLIEYPLDVRGETVRITSVNTGSTHAVIFGGSPPSEKRFQRVSPRIEHHPLFPERTSVLWATPQTDGAIAVRIWERGAGETWGCGTGACAVGVAAVLEGAACAGAPIPIVSKGGTLTITWPGEGAPVDMVGPAQVVFDGDFAFDAAF